jgi:DNA-binding SARP family transcriptional activator
MSIVALTSDDGTVNGQGGDLAFVRVLGPVQVVTTSQRSLDLPSASQRRLVALLATEAPRSLRTEWICDVLAVSSSALRTTVSRVRRTVGDGAIAGAQGRYRLAVPVDAALFTSAFAQVSSSDHRIEALERALAMWTGPAFDEFSAEAWAGPEVVRLTEMHASAVEDHAIELIAERRWAEAVAELQSHVAVHPLRDRPRGLLLQALAGAGRQADALGAFRDYGAYLAESVGTEPSAEVRRLDRRVASGWDGVEATAGNAGSSRRARRPAGWLPLTAELARGPRLIGRGRELARLASDLALVSGMDPGQSPWRAKQGSARRRCSAGSLAPSGTAVRRRYCTDSARAARRCPQSRFAPCSNTSSSTPRPTCSGPMPRGAEGS